MDDRSFLGRGWSFDVKPDRITGRICMCSGEDDIAQAVRLILNTKKGESVLTLAVNYIPLLSNHFRSLFVRQWYRK